jgi:hypothetical protein
VEGAGLPPTKNNGSLWLLEKEDSCKEETMAQNSYFARAVEIALHVKSVMICIASG